MTDYRKFIVEDFLTDPLFRAWVLNGDAQATNFWQHWLVGNPDRSEMVQAARALLLAMDEKRQTISDDELDTIVEGTLGKLSSNLETGPPTVRRMYLVWARVAAAVLVVAGLGWLVYKFPLGASFEAISTTSSPSEIRVERTNDTDRPMTVLLGDKSTVILQPGSRLSFSSALEKEPRRVVYLDGEAFFDVVKDPAHPFFVYSNQLITRVLGTSFRVVAYEREKQASVSVLTGKVTVFAKKDLEKMDRIAIRPGAGGLVLSPNEQVTFSQNKARFTKSRIQGLANLYHPPRFSFDETPVADVFSALEKAYGIDIEYEPEKLDGYRLTATFSEMSLHDELHLICRIIKGTYHIEEGRVIIETDR
ncbi:FecR family protein [Larkinella sp. GY13]|uniref:FecR family protein n=1 Tax=Larkinella sp. GY13 TaxID=3453720 RepID=UPI003EE9A6CF